MKRVSDLLSHCINMNYSLTCQYSDIESSWQKYGIRRNPELEFPFNYGITVQDLREDYKLLSFITKMEDLGIDFNTVAVPTWYNDTYTEHSRIDIAKLQAIVRLIFRIETYIDGRNTTKLEKDTKLVKLSDYVTFLLKISEYKIDTGTFLETLNIKMASQTPWRFILYDNKDIPTGYKKNLVTSCMTTNESNGSVTLDFYTMFDNIRLLAIEQGDKEIARCLLWKVGKDEWITDRIYVYKQSINMRNEVYKMLDKEVEIYNVSKMANETIKIIDLRTSDEAAFNGFMKNKIYASVQHLVGEIHPVTLSPYFDSARIAVIPKKYSKKITFVFAADTAMFNRYERNIHIRDRTDAIMREWTIFSDGKPITNKDNIIKIDGVYFVKGNIPLYLSEYNSISLYNSRQSDECSMVNLPHRLIHLLDDIEATDMDGRPVSLSKDLTSSVRIWVNNRRIVASNYGNMLDEDACLLVKHNGSYRLHLSTGTTITAEVLPISSMNVSVELCRLYSVTGVYRKLPIYVYEQDAVIAADGNVVYRSDAVEINGQYYISDNNLRGIEHDQCTI